MIHPRNLIAALGRAGVYTLVVSLALVSTAESLNGTEAAAIGLSFLGFTILELARVRPP